MSSFSFGGDSKEGWKLSNIVLNPPESFEEVTIYLEPEPGATGKVIFDDIELLLLKERTVQY